MAETMRIIILALFICAFQAARGPENCQPPQLDNGFFVPKLENYEHRVQIYYGCNEGLKPDLKTWWGVITCSDGKWSHTPRCIDKTWCISTFVPNAEPDVLEASSPGEVSLRCATGYKFNYDHSKAKCEAESWTLPECIPKPGTCAPPPCVLNGILTTPLRNFFEDGEKLEYACARGYKLTGNKMITCAQGSWSPVPSCETDTAKCEDGTWQMPVYKDPTSCTAAPDVPNAKPSGQLKSLYKDRDYVYFVCDGGYEFENYSYATCQRGTWSLPVCKRTWCPAPEVPNGRPTEQLKESYNNGQYVRFACNSGYELEKRDSYAKCQRGTWKLPVCKGAGGGGGGNLLPVRVCGSQPLVENGDVTELPGGMELKVQCARYYKLLGPATVGCVNGEWTELPVCIPPCKVEGKRIQPKQEDDYLPEGDEKTYKCGRVYTITVRCLNGQTLYGQCAWNG